MGRHIERMLCVFGLFFLYCKIPFSVGEVDMLFLLGFLLLKSVWMSEFGVEKSIYYIH